jgi:hypothetical protein
MRVELILILVATLSGPMAALATAKPRAGEPVLALFWPWQDAERLVTLAGGRIIGPVRAPLAVLAMGKSPDFAGRLSEQGALTVVDGTAIALLCTREGTRS